MEYYELLLFPAEWYDYIPDGFKVIGLSGKPDLFINGFSDDDIRYGCLSYGVFRSIN